MNFEVEHSFNYRYRLAQRLRRKHPDKIPLILTLKGTTYPLLINGEVLGRQLWLTLRRRFNAKDYEPMILFYPKHEIRIIADTTIYQQYLKYRHDDGLIYIDVLDKYPRCCIIL
jgi:hypothetical protein